MPAVGDGGQADGAAVEVRAGVVAEVLDVVQGVLDQPGQRAVVAGRDDDEPVGVADGVDELLRAFVALELARVVEGQHQVRARQQPRPDAGLRRRGERDLQRAFGLRALPQRAADPEHIDRPG